MKYLSLFSTKREHVFFLRFVDDIVDERKVIMGALRKTSRGSILNIVVPFLCNVTLRAKTLLTDERSSAWIQKQYILGDGQEKTMFFFSKGQRIILSRQYTFTSAKTTLHTLNQGLYCETQKQQHKFQEKCKNWAREFRHQIDHRTEHWLLLTCRVQVFNRKGPPFLTKLDHSQ